MPKVLWLLFIIIAGETEVDEPTGTINFFDDRAQCERAGAKVQKEFEENGGGDVRRNDDGTFCTPAKATWLEGPT